jgi:ubiquinone/menaquinone biosynthesis C-methylase UbiE
MGHGRPGGARGYVFDRTRADEERRLEKQSAVMDPFTDRLFRDGGLAQGMRVLELGSGAGDVAMLAARIVGPAGAVVGVEGSPVAIGTARRRAAAAGLHHVTFLEGDLRDLDGVLDPGTPPFDAVVGRFVLQFMPDPSAVLRAAAAAVRPGGLVCFQECDDHYTHAYPATPLWAQVRTWLLAALITRVSSRGWASACTERSAKRGSRTPTSEWRPRSVVWRGGAGVRLGRCPPVRHSNARAGGDRDGGRDRPPTRSRSD